MAKTGRHMNEQPQSFKNGIVGSTALQILHHITLVIPLAHHRAYTPEAGRKTVKWRDVLVLELAPYSYFSLETLADNTSRRLLLGVNKVASDAPFPTWPTSWDSREFSMF